jgi:hypothetical protein
MISGPIPISDEQWTVLLQSAQALLPVDRPYYLAALAEALRNEPLPLGDGALYRAIRLTQRTYWQPPRVTAPIAQDRRRVGEPLLE